MLSVAIRVICFARVNDDYVAWQFFQGICGGLTVTVGDNAYLDFRIDIPLILDKPVHDLVKFRMQRGLASE
jgi:hypothetical protein